MSLSRRPGRATTLRHNPLNAVTATVERITREDGSTYIRKELREPEPTAQVAGGPGSPRLSGAGQSAAERQTTGDERSEAERPVSRAGQSQVERQASGPGQSEAERPVSRPGQSQVERQASSAGQSEAERQASRAGQSEAERPVSRAGQSQVERQTSGAGRSEAGRPASTAGQSEAARRVSRAGRSEGGRQVSGAGRSGGGPWAGSADPRHWNYWLREAEVYRDGEVRTQLRGTGLVLPAAEVEEVDGGAVLYLEDVAGLAGTEFGLEDHAALARACGRWQARPAVVRPWTSVGFLRDYSTTRQVPWGLLHDDAAWRQPLVADNWPAGLREGWERVVAQRDELLTIVEQAPRAGCHLDLWVCNAIRRADGEIALLDWAFCGDGALGEDVGNHIPDAVFDLFWPAERLPELAETCINSYLEGLREGGWRGEADVVRRSVMAAAVKYAWLLPGLLGRASDSSHKAYHQEADSQHLFQQRGLALKFVADWCAEALKG